MTADFLTILSQFGPAGLLGLLWIVERRHAVLRDRQLSQSHRRIVEQSESVEALMNLIRDNTRALVALEHTQRQLIELVQQLMHWPRRRAH